MFILGVRHHDAQNAKLSYYYITETLNIVYVGTHHTERPTTTVSLRNRDRLFCHLRMLNFINVYFLFAPCTILSNSLELESFFTFLTICRFICFKLLAVNLDRSSLIYCALQQRTLRLLFFYSLIILFV